jgi:protein gp37
MGSHRYRDGFEVTLQPDQLALPLRWRTPRMIFVNSMSDLFQEAVPDEYVLAVAKVMAIADWHTYQVLTKRADRLRRMLAGRLADVAARRHIWWGVSVENKRHGLPRIEELRQAPAAVRFLSIEPLLEDLGRLDLSGIHWAIVGGESGPGARPLKREWVESIRDQCAGARVPFFFKQWGGVNKGRTGRQLNGRTYDEVPPVHPAAVPDVNLRASLIVQVERAAAAHW